MNAEDALAVVQACLQSTDSSVRVKTVTRYKEGWGVGLTTGPGGNMEVQQIEHLPRALQALAFGWRIMNQRAADGPETSAATLPGYKDGGLFEIGEKTHRRGSAVCCDTHGAGICSCGGLIHVGLGDDGDTVYVCDTSLMLDYAVEGVRRSCPHILVALRDDHAVKPLPRRG